MVRSRYRRERGLLTATLGVVSVAAFGTLALPAREQEPAWLSAESASEVVAAASSEDDAAGNDVARVQASDPESRARSVEQRVDTVGKSRVRPTPAVTRSTEREAAARIVISLARRRLWLVRGRDTVVNTSVAIGMNKDFVYEGKTYRFATPRGKRRIIGKAPNPIWTVPEWHYYEKAAAKRLVAVKLTKDSKFELEDGSFIVVLGDQVGRVNQNGYFAPFTPGNEIIFDGRIFIPHMESAQRKVPDALGPYKLDMGDGYLIHGTHMYTDGSIGQAVSHGCVRMNNRELERLYHLVDRGTPVQIF